MSGLARRFLALGDSYTIGEGVAHEERWPAKLARLLEARGLGPVELEIVAKTGWTTDELSAAIDAAAPVGPYDLVSLLIGVNDQYRGRSVSEYRERIRGLLRRAVGFAGGRPERVIVVSIPDWGVTPFAAAERRDPVRVAAEIDAYNAVNWEEAVVARAAYVDVTRLSRVNGAPEFLVADTLHPSGAAYAAWADSLLPMAVGVLSSNADGT